MIPEPQQEQGVLYALGLLDAEEASGFERQMASDPALQDFARDCREASATLILADDSAQGKPPQELKNRVLRQLEAPSAGKVVPFISRALPWAVAASLAVFCGIFATRQGSIQSDNIQLRGTLAMMQRLPAPTDLATVSLCQLEPAAAKVSAEPRVIVAWNASRHEGVLQVVQLTPPDKDKDYQLWAVEEGRKDAVSAGLVRVDARGRAQVVFKPEAVGGSGRVQAFALSLEQAGGSPKNAGPIVLLGKL